MHIPTGILLLRVIDELMPVALHCPITAGGVHVEATARVHRQVGCLLHRFDREISGRLDTNSPLATDPGDHRRPVFVLMATTGLAFLATATRAAPQRLLATAWRLPFVAGRMVEVIGFDRPLQLALHLLGQGGIA